MTRGKFEKKEKEVSSSGDPKVAFIMQCVCVVRKEPGILEFTGIQQELYRNSIPEIEFQYNSSFQFSRFGQYLFSV